MSDKQVVISVFENEGAADAAVESLKSWDKVSKDVKLGAIGVLVLDEKGQVKTQKMGKRSIGKGAGIGVVLAIVAPPLGAGTIVAGGLLGALHRKGLGLDEADVIAAKLKELGGDSEVHEASDEALEQAAVEAPPEAPVKG